MFWRTFIFAFLAVEALAVKPELTGQLRQSIRSTLTAVCNINSSGDAQEKAEQLTNSLQSFYNCLYPIVDTDTLKAEIKNANGTLDEVVKKYCAKTPEFKTCYHTLIDATSPCVVERAKNQLPLLKNETDQLFDYLCHEDGNIFIRFLTVNGLECYESKRNEIDTCTAADILQSQVYSSLKNVLSVTLAERCRIKDRLNTCIVKSLKTCTPPTLGYMVEYLVTYVRKGSACNDVLPLPPQ